MKTLGAILRGAPGKHEVAELEPDEPREAEVLVKLAARGCATPTTTSPPVTRRYRCSRSAPDTTVPVWCRR
jgi:hypothetical protein